MAGDRVTGTIGRIVGLLGWFALGLACLAAASFVVESLLATAAVTGGASTSIWTTRPAVALGAFVAATAAVGLTRRHRRLGQETLRAAWAVAVIDIVLAAASMFGGAVPLGGTAAYEGVGFLTAALVMTDWPRARAAVVRGRDQRVRSR